MGFNIAGILTNQEMKDEMDLKNLFQKTLKYNKDVSGEEATLSKFHSEYDVYSTEKGTIIFLELGELYDFSDSKGEFIQFMISDTSDTYYFEKIKEGIVERKLILSQGEIAEDEGEGIINDEDDFEDIIFELTKNLLGIEDVFEVNFKRFE